jgi:hypothetical protein
MAVKMSVLVFSPVDGGSMFLRNATYLQAHTTLLPRRPILTKKAIDFLCPISHAQTSTSAEPLLESPYIDREVEYPKWN